MVTREIVTEPENLKEAESQPDWPIWKRAMKIEMDQHDKFGTWKLVEIPTGRTAIGCHWVYAVKTTPDGDFEKAKAHLVAQGFTQRPRMDYYDITSPVVKFNSICMILAMVNDLNWEMEMMDVKGAYLNSVLDKEIYMALYCMVVALDGYGWYLELSGCCIVTVWAQIEKQLLPLAIIHS